MPNNSLLYNPGAQNPADFLSQHSLPSQPVTDMSIADESVNYLMDNAVPKSLTTDEIQKGTQDDPAMQKLEKASSSIRTKLPEDNGTLQDDAVLARDSSAKAKMTIRADKRAGAQSSVIQEGDTLLLKQRKTNKLSTSFDTEPYSVVRKKGSMLAVVNRKGRKRAHNISQAKKVPAQENWDKDKEDGHESEDDRDLDEDIGVVPQEAPPQPDAPRAPEDAPLRRNPARARQVPARFRKD